MRSLTHSEAIARAELLSVSAYDIDLDLTGAHEDEHFTSTATVRFTCRAPGAETFVELKPASVLRPRAGAVLEHRRGPAPVHRS